MSRCGRVPRRCAPPSRHHDHVAPADVVAARHDALRCSREHRGLGDEDRVGLDAIVEHIVVAVDGDEERAVEATVEQEAHLPVGAVRDGERRRLDVTPRRARHQRSPGRFERGDVQVERLLLLREDAAGEERFGDLSHHPRARHDLGGDAKAVLDVTGRRADDPRPRGLPRTGAPRNRRNAEPWLQHRGDAGAVGIGLRLADAERLADRASASLGDLDASTESGDLRFALHVASARHDRRRVHDLAAVERVDDPADARVDRVSVSRPNVRVEVAVEAGDTNPRRLQAQPFELVGDGRSVGDLGRAERCRALALR